jgi:integrase
LSDRLYRKKPGGTWYGWYFDRAGRQVRICTKVRDRRTALAVLREAEAAAHAPDRPAGPAPHSVADALRWFIEEGPEDLADQTLAFYARKAGHLLRLLGPVDVNALELDQVHRYTVQRLDEGAARSTVAKELVTLRRALRCAQERGLFLRDPRQVLPGFRVRYVPRTRHLTAAELEQLLDELPETRRLWVLVAVFTGARAGELERLAWSDVDPARGWIALPGTKTAGARRVVPIAAELAPLVADAAQRSGPVVGRWGNARRDLAQACERAGLAPVSPNDLRRTFASWLKQAGVDSAAVAKLLGHTSSRMVDLVYGHLTDATRRAAVEQLPRLGPGDKRVIDEGGSRGPRRPKRKAAFSETPENAASEVPRGGIEPPTRGFSSLASRRWRPRLVRVGPRRTRSG